MKFIFAKRDLTVGHTALTFHEEEQDELPPLQSYEVVVEVKACALSKLDKKVVEELLVGSESLQLPASLEVSGIISATGKDVSAFSVGDKIAGLLPLTSSWTACADKCILREHDIVRLPEDVSYEVAAASLADGLKAFTALQYLTRISAGDTVLIFDGASSSGSIMIQLAHIWGAKVITTASSSEDTLYLEKMQPPPDHILELGTKNNILVSEVMEETGSLGADIIIDSGVKLFSNEEDSNMADEEFSKPVPYKQDIINCLAVNGKWITTHPSLQLDPPNCHQLYLKGASVGFMFEQTWLLANSQQGRYQNILHNLCEKLSSGQLKPNISRILSYDGALPALKEEYELANCGKTVIRIS